MPLLGCMLKKIDIKAIRPSIYCPDRNIQIRDNMIHPTYLTRAMKSKLTSHEYSYYLQFLDCIRDAVK